MSAANDAVFSFWEAMAVIWGTIVFIGGGGVLLGWLLYRWDKQSRERKP